MTVRIPDLVLTPSERRLLLKVLDAEWWHVNRQREQDSYLDDVGLLYQRELEGLIDKVKS